MLKKNIALTIFLFFLIGCNTRNDEIQLNVIGENASNLKALNLLKSGYETKSGIKITYHPYSFDDAFTKSTQDFRNKTGIYDIVMQYNFSLSLFARNDYVYNINTLAKSIDSVNLVFQDDLFENAWREVGFYKDPFDPIAKLEKLGYPFASNTMILAYNQEMFSDNRYRKLFLEKYDKELMPPKTWDEYFEIAEFFTMKNKNLYGVCLQGATGSWLYYEWCNFLFSFGGKVMDKQYGWEGNDSTKILLNSENAIAATKFYLKLKPFNAGDYFTIGAYEQIRLMKQGNIAMSIIWSDLAYDLINDGENKYDNRFGFTVIPGDVSGLAGGAFFINKESKNPIAAFKYIVDVMQPENQIELLKNGLCSALESAYNSPEVQDIPYLEALRLSLKRGTYMFEAGPDATMINERITTFIQKIWSGELTVIDGLNKLTEEIKSERSALFSNL